MSETTTKLTAERLLRLFSVIHLIRHGKASPAAEGQPDSTRELNEIGIGQVTSMATDFADITFDLVVSSPLTRAMKTAEMVSRQAPVPIEALGVSEDPSDPLNIMFNELKYLPPGKYFEHALGDHLKVWAHKALESIVEAAEKAGIVEGEALVGGHAVMTPAIVWAIGCVLEQDGNEAGAHLKESMLNVALNEAAVITVDFISPGVLAVVNNPL